MKKFFAGLFAFIILVLFPIVLLSTITIYWVFTPSTIKTIIHTSQVGENLPGVIVAMAAQQGSDASTAADFISTTFNANDVYSLTDPLVDGVGTWFNTDKPIEQLDLTINVTDLKTKLAPAITTQINASGVSLPDCGTIDMSGATFANGLDDAIKSACATSTTSLSDQIMQKIPDTINIKDQLQQQLTKNSTGDQLAMVNQQVNLIRWYWQVLHWVVWIGWVVIGCGLLFIVLLRLHPGYTPFGWLAWLELLKFFELIPITLAVWLAPQFILPWISGSFSNAVLTVVNKALSALLNVYLWPLALTMGGLCVSSIFWFIIRGLVKHHITHKTQPPITQPATPVTNTLN